MQETLVKSLIQEDPTYHGAAEPMHHNYGACVQNTGGLTTGLSDMSQYFYTILFYYHKKLRANNPHFTEVSKNEMSAIVR